MDATDYLDGNRFRDLFHVWKEAQQSSFFQKKVGKGSNKSFRFFVYLHTDKIKTMKTVKVFLWLALSVSFFSCGKQLPLADEVLQASADSLLRVALNESFSDSALVMVMSVKTGDIRLRKKIVKDYHVGGYVEGREASLQVKTEPGPVFIPFSIMAAMDEIGGELSDMVDAGNGRYVLHDRTIYDQEVFDKGGYGMITLGQSVTLPSFVGAVKTVETAFDGKVGRFEKRMFEMGLGLPSDSNVFSDTHLFESMMNAFTVGYYFKLTPEQLLSMFSALANNGRMMTPKNHEGPDVELKASIARPSTVKAMQSLLVANGAKLFPETPDVAVMKGFSSIKSTYKREVVCTYGGYYPSSNPAFACLVVLYRSEATDSDAQKGRDAVTEAGKNVFSEVRKWFN
jgi:cell division protein FtsI (penicillin-binding protein 3)